MTNDLVKRLRKMVPHCSDPRDYPSDDADILEAADRIEELELICKRLANSKAFDEREVIRREALEEAARVVETINSSWAPHIAAAIRKLMEKGE